MRPDIKAYNKTQRSCRLERGDFVTVARIAEDGECPSGYGKWEEESRRYLGKSGKIVSVSLLGGPGVDVYFQEPGWTVSLPCFVLKKAHPAYGIMKPFDPVLVRQDGGEPWFCALYEKRVDGGYRVMGGMIWKQCVPYRNNEYLVPEFG